jgi:nucleotide-binding universal stress UspA family protein
MLEIKLILCPVDFSEFSTRAYRYALSLAEHYRAKLVAQHIVELSRYPYAEYVASHGDYQDFRRAVGEGGEQKLREFVKQHAHDAIQQDLMAHEGVASDCILSFAHARKADLIVMGTHGRRGFDRLVLGSVTDRVMRRAPCPVLAISKLPHDFTASGEEQRHVHHLSRILFCTDFSENAERALNYAISATEEYDAELTQLHVLEEVSSPAQTKEAVASATEQLDKLIPRAERKTLTGQDGGSYRKTIPANHSARAGGANRHGDHGSEWPRDMASSGVWFDNLSSDSVGAVPCPRRPYLNRKTL